MAPRSSESESAPTPRASELWRSAMKKPHGLGATVQKVNGEFIRKTVGKARSWESAMNFMFDTISPMAPELGQYEIRASE